MPWQQIVGFKCTDCGRFYETLPNECICVKAVFYKGRLSGSFIIEGPPDDSGIVQVTCVLCGMTTNIHYTNIKKQISCGCKPKYIRMLKVTKDIVQYKCDKCQSVTNAVPPIVVYCCEEEK